MKAKTSFKLCRNPFSFLSFFSLRGKVVMYEINSKRLMRNKNVVHGGYNVFSIHQSLLFGHMYEAINSSSPHEA